MISRVKKRRKRVNEDINLEEWKEYFMKLMGGKQSHKRKRGERKMERRGDRTGRGKKCDKEIEDRKSNRQRWNTERGVEI